MWVVVIFATVAMTRTATNTTKMEETARVAKEKARVICAMVDDVSPVSPKREEATVYLEALGGTPNDFDNVLVASRDGSTEDFIQNIATQQQEHWSSAAVLGTIPSLVIALVLFIIASFCVCQCFPCCRVGQRDRGSPGRGLKIGVCALFFIFSAGLIGTVIVASVNEEKVLDGADQFACAGVQFVDTTLTGQDYENSETSFKGFIPLLGDIDNIASLISANSSFIAYVNDLVNETKDIEIAITQFTGTLNLAGDSLDVAPMEYHKCVFCDFTKTQLRDASSVLSKSLPGTLEDTRQVVRDALNDEGNLASLRAQFDQAKEPLVSAGNDFATEADKVLEVNYRKIRQDPAVIFYVWLTVIPLMVVVSLILLCNCCSIATFSHTSTNDEKDDNKHSKRVMKSAGKTWICSCCCASFLLLIGGIFTFLLNMPSGACLVADTMNGKKANELSEVLGSPLSNQTIAVWDTCLTEEGDGRVLDTIIRDDCSDKSRKCTLQVKVDETIDSITNTINDVNVSGLFEMRDMPEMQQLLDLFKLPVGALIFTDTANILSDARFSMLASDPRGLASRKNGLQVGLQTGLECDDNTINVTVPLQALGFPEDISGSEVVYGIQQFVDNLDSFSYDVYDQETTDPVPDTEASGVQCPFLESASVACPSTDVASADQSTLRGLARMISICAVVKDRVNLSDPQFDSSLAIFREEMAKKIAGQEANDTELNAALDYMMNRDEQSQDIGRMTCDPCTAGNNLLRLKHDIRTNSVFQCPTFEKDGEVCDNADQDVDCTFNDNGKTTIKKRDAMCNYAEWNAHFARFRQRYENVMQTADNLATELAPKIKTDLVFSVHKAFIAPVKDLFDNLGCRHLFDAKTNVLGGVCFGGAISGVHAISISYSVAGGMAFLLGLLVFVIWRHAADNVSAWAQLNSSDTSTDASDDVSHSIRGSICV